MDQLLDRMVETGSATVMSAFEKRIDILQKDQMILEEKLARTARPERPFDEMYRTALHFLSNPSGLC